MAFSWRDGVHLGGSDLWFDAARSPGLNFVSHGGIRAKGSRLLASQPTAKVIRALGKRARPLAAPFGRPVTIGSSRVELLASDLLPGAASLYVKRQNLRALYAGRIGKNADLRTCDALCIEAPEVGSAAPPLDEVAARAKEETTVLLAPGLPEAFAAASELSAAGVAVRAQLKLCAALRALGAAVSVFRAKLRSGEVLLWPLDQWSESPPANLDDPHPVVLAREGADWPEVVSFARATAATQVIVAGPHAREAATRMASEGVPARPIATPDQLPLFAGSASG